MFWMAYGMSTCLIYSAICFQGSRILGRIGIVNGHLDGDRYQTATCCQQLVRLAVHIQRDAVRTAQSIANEIKGRFRKASCNEKACD
jgi:hypothetical protein